MEDQETGGGVEKKAGVELFKGALIERVDVAFNKVMENIVDLNTEAEAPRVITVKIKIKPMADRRHLETKLRVTESLAPYKDVDGMITAKFRDKKAILYEDSGNQLEMDIEYETQPLEVVKATK